MDPDTGTGGHMRYTCEHGCDEGNFAVSARDGSVRVIRRLDCDEGPSTRVLTVLATDGGPDAMSASVSVTVSGEANARTKRNHEFH